MPQDHHCTQKKLSGKTRGIGSFAKTQGILFAQVVHFLLLIQDTVRFAAEIWIFSKSVSHMILSQISEFDTGTISSRTGKHGISK